MAYERSCVTGAVPPPARLRGWCMLTLGLKAPGCLPAAILCAGIRSKGGRGIWAGWHKPLEVRPPASPGATPHDADRKPRSLAGGYPQGLASPRRPHSSPTRRRTSPWPKTMPRSVLKWAKLHSHACRGASRRSCPLTKVSERTVRTLFVPVCQAVSYPQSAVSAFAPRE